MDWFDGEGEWLSLREGEGGQNSVLARGREGTRKNELVLGGPTYL